MVSPAFYTAYRRAWPLHEDYEQRKPLYSLYHPLNHLNLFGCVYLRESSWLATRLNEELARRRTETPRSRSGMRRRFLHSAPERDLPAQHTYFEISDLRRFSTRA